MTEHSFFALWLEFADGPLNNNCDYPADIETITLSCYKSDYNTFDLPKINLKRGITV